MVELNKVSSMCLFYIWESWFSVFFLIVFSNIESLMLVQIIVLQIMVQ